MKKGLLSSFSAPIGLWKKYWVLYGGFRALFGSLYFFLALMVTAINYFAWSRPGWWDVVISTIPTLLGFTLAGLAVFLSMDSGFSKVIAGGGDSKKASPFVSLVNSFVHFIVVQVLALLYAISAKSLYVTVDGLPQFFYEALPVLNKVAGLVGFLIYIYAIFLLVSATFAIFRSSLWYDNYVDAINGKEEDNCKCKCRQAD